jgi:hypothetical protein
VGEAAECLGVNQGGLGCYMLFVKPWLVKPYILKLKRKWDKQPNAWEFIKVGLRVTIELLKQHCLMSCMRDSLVSNAWHAGCSAVLSHCCRQHCSLHQLLLLLPLCICRCLGAALRCGGLL